LSVVVRIDEEIAVWWSLESYGGLKV